MKVIYTLKDITRYKNPVVAIGVFDGLHRGHRHILQAMVARAQGIKGTSIVLTFYPHPHAKESIYSLPHRLRLFEEFGIAVCIVVRFDLRFSRIQARDFIERILVKKIKARSVYIGENFRFGAKAKGDVALLQKASLAYGFQVKACSVIRYRHREISSTVIRGLILSGNLKEAEGLLLRPVSVLGKVIRGSGMATRLGFPTANIFPSHEITPPSGIYCVWVMLKGIKLKGICYIGARPTFHRHYKKNIEVHIFNFRKNIYGKVIEIQFLRKIRQERVFSSPEALRTQIKNDILIAQKTFLLNETTTYGTHVT